MIVIVTTTSFQSSATFSLCTVFSTSRLLNICDNLSDAKHLQHHARRVLNCQVCDASFSIAITYIYHGDDRLNYAFPAGELPQNQPCNQLGKRWTATTTYINMITSLSISPHRNRTEGYKRNGSGVVLSVSLCRHLAPQKSFPRSCKFDLPLSG